MIFKVRIPVAVVESDNETDAVGKMGAALTALVAERETTDSVAARLSDLEDSYKGLAAELGEMRERTRQAGKSNADFFPLAKAEWDALRGELASARSKIATLEERTPQDHRDDIKAHEEGARKLRSDISRLDAELDAAQAANVDAARQIVALEVKQADTVDILNAERKAHEHTKRATIADLTQRLREKEDTIETLGAANMSHQKATAELRTNLTGMRHACERAEKDRDEARVEREAMFANLTSTQARCTELLQETRELRRFALTERVATERKTQAELSNIEAKLRGETVTEP